MPPNAGTAHCFLLYSVKCAAWTRKKRFPLHFPLHGAREYKVLAYAAAFVFVAVGTAVSYNNGWGTAGKTANQTAARTTYTNDGAADYGVTSGTYLNSKAAGTSASYEAPMMLADSFASEEMAAEEASGVEREAKIVRTVNFTVRTQQYEQDYDEIRMLVEEYGGRIESLNTSGDGTAYSLRRANYTLRIASCYTA